MGNPADLKYSKEHLWVRVSGGEATIGITDHAQRELGDVVFFETPKPGSALVRSKTFGVVESVKAVSDLVAPVSGQVLRVNEELARAPELVNQDPFGSAWVVVVRLADPGEVAGLMGAAEYDAHLAEITRERPAR